MAQISEFSSVFIFMDKKKSSCAFWNRKIKVQLSLESSCVIRKGLDEIVKLLQDIFVIMQVLVRALA